MMKAVLLPLLVVGASIAHDIDYQIHSFNDLYLMPQLLAKGTTWFKFDPHYMDSSFCKSQDAVADPDQGCLVLNHDLPIALRQYNTTQQLIKLLTTPSWQAYRQRNHVHIALCFKLDGGVDPCGNSTTAQNWLKVTDDVFNDINATSLSNVTWILDGVATPSKGRECLASRWQPWNATWISTHDPQSALTDDNVTNGDSRFQVNNMEEGHPPAEYLVKLQQANYGKLLTNGQPFLFWEPADQPSINAVLAAYQQGPISSTSFRFATNTDPLQVSLYASRVKGNMTIAFNASWTAFKSTATSALVDGDWMITQTSLGDTIVMLNGHQEAILTNMPNLTTVAAIKEVGVLVANHSHYAIIDNNESIVFHPVPCDNAQLADVREDARGMIWMAYLSGTTLTVVKATLEDDFRLTAVATNTLPQPRPLTSASLIGVTENGAEYGAIIVVSDGNDVSLMGLDAKLNVQVQRVISKGFAVQMASNDNDVWIVINGGFCYNTNSGNKQPIPRTCKQEPILTTAVVTYTATTMSGLVELLNMEGHVTPCTILPSQRLLHGTLGLAEPLSLAIRSNGFIQMIAKGLTEQQVTALKGNDEACGVPVAETNVMRLQWRV
eukprot:TRINITY_DN2789_c0_g1_i2.p1 TRINITY_DN2789_c0_g1~~TRINITY_DN2789_c0_g1_i2.p1  ORF type:complete len:608 (+),score=114.92 TRINITY_DN2789_c0_g1_i2:3-1826(+)